MPVVQSPCNSLVSDAASWDFTECIVVAVFFGVLLLFQLNGLVRYFIRYRTKLMAPAPRLYGTILVSGFICVTLLFFYVAEFGWNSFKPASDFQTIDDAATRVASTEMFVWSYFCFVSSGYVFTVTTIPLPRKFAIAWVLILLYNGALNIARIIMPSPPGGFLQMIFMTLVALGYLMILLTIAGMSYHLSYHPRFNKNQLRDKQLLAHLYVCIYRCFVSGFAYQYMGINIVSGGYQAYVWPITVVIMWIMAKDFLPFVLLLLVQWAPIDSALEVPQLAFCGCGKTTDPDQPRTRPLLHVTTLEAGVMRARAGTTLEGFQEEEVGTTITTGAVNEAEQLMAEPEEQFKFNSDWEYLVSWMNLNWPTMAQIMTYAIMNLIFIAYGLHDICSSAAGQLGIPIIVAKVSGKIVMLNFPLVFLSVPPTVLTWIRSSVFSVFVSVMNEHMTLHAMAASVTTVAGVVHTVAHVCDFVNLFKMSYAQVEAASQGNHLMEIYLAPNLYTLIPVWTGIVMMFLFPTLLLMGFARKIDCCRRNCSWEAFIFSHRYMGIMCLAMYVSHTAGRYFGAIQWSAVVIAPFGLLYLVDYFIRIPFIGMRLGTVTYVNPDEYEADHTVIYSPTSGGGGVLQLCLRVDVPHAPGDMFFIRCDYIFRLYGLVFKEYHPFTATSYGRLGVTGQASDEACMVRFQIECHGPESWTGGLALLLKAQGRLPPLYLDGPYSTPSRAVFHQNYVVLMGSGIGVTPALSIFKSFLMFADPKELYQIHFIWSTKDPKHFIKCLNELYGLLPGLPWIGDPAERVHRPAAKNLDLVGSFQCFLTDKGPLPPELNGDVRMGSTVMRFTSGRRMQVNFTLAEVGRMVVRNARTKPQFQKNADFGKKRLAIHVMNCGRSLGPAIQSFIDLEHGSSTAKQWVLTSEHFS